VSKALTWTQQVGTHLVVGLQHSLSFDQLSKSLSK
jgi:hypothetical protein